MIQARANELQYVKLPDGSYGKFKIDADDAAIVAAIEKDFPQTKPWLIYQSLAHRVGGPDFIPDKGTHDDRTPTAPAPYTEQRYAEVDPWQLAAAEGESRQEFSDVNKDGIKTIF